MEVKLETKHVAYLENDLSNKCILHNKCKQNGGKKNKTEQVKKVIHVNITNPLCEKNFRKNQVSRQKALH